MAGKERSRFESPDKLVLGFLTGVVFGFLLQKGRVAKFEVIVGQFLLRDWTVVKTMGTAVVVGAIGVCALVAADAASLHIKPALLGGVLIGAVCFGVGMAVFGYCPGTSVAGCGGGRRDAMVGVVGMLTGAAAFVATYPVLQPLIKELGDWGKITLPEVTHTSPWLWIGALSLIGLGAFIAERLSGHRPQQRRDRAPRDAHA
jgi:uncharacterized membrane protein YedE/YeeE